MAAPLAAMPLFRKAHSRGEFVFDFSWAERLCAAWPAVLPKVADGGAVHSGVRAAPAARVPTPTPKP